MSSDTHKRPMMLWVLLICAALGAVFAAVASRDFLAHLDRQVHAVTCSFIPGVGAADRSGTTGCYAALMSPYSSVMRTSLWGGIPIALPALSVFAFLLFLGVELAVRRAWSDRHETLFVLLATMLPLLVSVLYFGLSWLKLGTFCKTCIGIYVASAGVFISALSIHVGARRASSDLGTATTVPGTAPAARVGPGGTVHPPPSAAGPAPLSRWALRFLGGVAFVAVPIFLYAALKPTVAEAVNHCGGLLHPEDKYHVRIKLRPSIAGAPSIEVLDPLCPACHAFARRLEASGLGPQLDLEAVLFPLDKECNWMVTESPHPGACAVSEAVLCASPEGLPEVLRWAEEHATELREIGARGSARVYARIRERFPALAGCVGKPAVKVRLNKSLRWVVSNSLPVLTPQLFIRGRKICDEDTDLGLDYSLARLLEHTASGGGAAGGEAGGSKGGKGAAR